MYQNKRNFKTNSRVSYKDKTTFDNDSVKPTGEGSREVAISEKALKNLPKSSVTLKVDPYTNVEPHSQPYNILAPANRKMGGTYTGEDNLDGGNVQQYANSRLTGFLKSIDFARLKLALNYRYMPCNRGRRIKTNDVYSGDSLVDEAKKAISEAVSMLQATTFTQLAINSYVLVTDLPMGTTGGKSIPTNTFAKPANITDKEWGEAKLYEDLPDVLYGSFMYYQLFLQNILNAFNWHNSFRLKQGMMIRSAWNREVPQLNALFGVFNKKSFLNLLDGLSLSFNGEYVDRDWIPQANMINLVPSRKSNSMHDPVCEIQTTYNMPKICELYSKSQSGDSVTYTPIFSANSAAMTNALNAINSFIDSISAYTIMKWARQSVNDGVTDLVDSTNQYINNMTGYIQKINTGVTYFKQRVSDIREVMDIMSRTGTVSWVKGYMPTVTQSTDGIAVENLIVSDIYRLAMSGASKVEYSTSTKRWRSFSLWNIYNGIPEYDAKSGGAFLSLSLKDITIPSDEDRNIGYLPIALTNVDDSNTYRVDLLNRDGETALIESRTVKMSTDTVLARLAPLPSQKDLEIKVPTLVTDKLSTVFKSHIYGTLLNLFGVSNTPIKSGTAEVGLDPDYLAIYQFEIEDFTNTAIAYARNNSPFHAQTLEIDKQLGFYGSSKQS